MKILIIRTKTSNKSEYTTKHLKQIKKVNKNLEIKVVDPDQKIVNRHLPETEVILCSRYGFNDFCNLYKTKRLRWIHTTSTGVGDLANFLQPTNILLTNSSGVASIPIAEHVILLMLAFSRQLYQAYKYQQERIWGREINFPKPVELYKKSVGIIGFGRIGQQVARLAKSFGMTIHALQYENTIHKNLVDKIYKRSDLGKMLSAADFIICCLPLTDKTKHLFKYKQFGQMKRTAYFINVGKGATVDEETLIKALREKLIAGAGLDVFEKEPLSKTSKLWRLKEVIITPHYAGNTAHYTDRVVNIFCDNLKAYLTNQKLPTLVDKSKGY